MHGGCRGGGGGGTAISRRATAVSRSPGRSARGAEGAQTVAGQGAREAKLGEIDLEAVFETA